MKQVNKLITTKHSTSQTQAGQKALNDEDLSNVNYVYARLKTIFASKYTITFPTEKAEAGSKLEWAGDIARFDKEELERGLVALKSSDINWPDVKSFLSFCKPARVEPMHQEYQLPKPSNIYREEGRKKSAKLIAMMMKGSDNDT